MRGARDGCCAWCFDLMELDGTPHIMAPLEYRRHLLGKLLKRAIDRFGPEGPAELGTVEALLAVLDRAVAKKTGGPKRSGLQQHKLKQTLAGALVSLTGGRIRVEPAPARRRRTE